MVTGVAVLPKFKLEDVIDVDDMDDVKPKRSPSPSVPPTPNDDADDMKASPCPTPRSDSKRPASAAKLYRGTPSSSRSSATPTPTPKPAANGNGKAKSKPQLIGDLPRAEDKAMRTFEELEENHYQYSTLGRSREALESMTCDCSFAPGRDDPEMACGHDSDCINRLTQVECLEDDCRCRGYCKNQRLQRKEYADIEIVQTEKKGFGLRAGSDISKDAFIYEYIGDVVSQPSFAKRMRDYAEEGIRHFYFMMLQKDEFIDATKRGGKGRFANHSCNPNCYVAKWTVGQRVCMGIYAKRNIKRDEELTFNYNVDRYGHDAQPCYCGEPNCVGVLGGKTQTDVAAMDDLYLDALGISEEVEMYGLKGTKKKKGKKLDEDYTPVLKPLVEKDIPKVVQAIRQTQSRKVLLKLLSRIKMTDDQPALRQLMRLRGYSLMCNILEDYLSDIDICIATMESITTWPLLQRNKVEDSKIEEPIGALTKHENENVSSLAKKLLDQWAALEVGYRIPKRLKGDGEEASTPATPEVITFEERTVKRLRKGNVSVIDLPKGDSPLRLKPLGRRYVPIQRATPPLKSLSKKEKEEEPKEQYWWQLLKVDPEKVKEDLKKQQLEMQAQALAEQQKAAARYAAPEMIPLYGADRDKKIIDNSLRKAAEERKREQERIDAEKKKEEREEAERRRKRAKEKEKEKARRAQLSAAEKEALKEKRLQKLVGSVVVKCMSKHRDQLDHDTFKKHAKELTCIIAEKEKKSSSYTSNKLDALSEEKIVKIKKFSKEYIAKLLRRLEKQNSHSHSDDKPSRSNPGSRPSGSGSGSGDPHREDRPMMSVEDALDLGPEDSYHDNDNDNDNDVEDDEEKSGDPSPASDANGQGPGPAVAVVGRDVDVDAAELDGDGDVQMVGTTHFGSASPLKRGRWDETSDSTLRADL